MNKSLIFFTRFYAFWLLYFFTDRLFFLILFRQKLQTIPLKEISLTFWHALRLDISMTAYLNIIPFFVFSFYLFKKDSRFPMKWINVYNKIFIILFSLLSVINFNIYREWGAKINDKAFGFLIHTPNEALASSASSPLLLSAFVFIALIGIALLLYRLIMHSEYRPLKLHSWIKAIIIIFLFGLNFLCIRGGLGVAPNNQSMAYFSEQQLLNHASLNTEWNLISSLLAAKKTNKNPYIYLNQAEAKKNIEKLYKVEKDSSINILQTKRPNVVLFILESFTANLTQTLGNEPGITPNFDRLIKEGFLFSHIYATGNRTDKGVVGSLAAFPTLASGSIVKWPEKMQKIPAISQVLAKEKYHTSFFYGGESEFDNYKAFILSHGYQKLVDRNSFNPDDMNSKWGAYDGLVFERQLHDMSQTPEPFFSTILSLTNHEPFEVPGDYKFGRRDNIERFKSTAYYTDSCIGAYLNEAKKQAWYKNTLFIFIADHGHLYPRNKDDIYMPDRYHIPLLFYGDALKKEYTGKKSDKLGSQTDLAATLLSQLGLPAQSFSWSKNLLNPYTKHFAFYTWDNGFGFMTPQQAVSFDNVGKRTLFQSDKKNEAATQENLNLGKSYLQTVYQQFINL